MLGFPIAVDALFVIAVLTYFVGGAVKGTFGLGMPVTVVSIMSFVSDIRTAVLLVLAPIVATNLWQIMRSGQVSAVFNKYWRLALSMTFVLLVTSVLAVNAPVSLVMLCLGIAVVMFASMNLWICIPTIPDRLDATAQVVAGVFTGVLGGMTGLVVVPLVAYFSARNLDKDTFVMSTSPFFLLGGLLLVASFTRSGHFTPGVALYSLVLVVPAVIGVIVGERLRQFIPNAQFKRLVLFLFLLMGVNLLRRGLGY